MKQDDDLEVQPVKITVERRWQAARRLAAGDDLHLAAARAGLHEDQVARMLDEDPGFRKLIEAARAVFALGPEERQAAAAELAQEALEDQLGSRNATVINNSMRLMAKSGKPGGDAFVNEDLPVLDRNSLFMAAMGFEELVEYLWIGVRDHVPFDEREGLPFKPPEDFANRVRVLNNKLQHIAIQQQGSANDDEEDGEPPGD